MFIHLRAPFDLLNWRHWKVFNLPTHLNVPIWNLSWPNQWLVAYKFNRCRTLSSTKTLYRVETTEKFKIKHLYFKLKCKSSIKLNRLNFLAFNSTNDLSRYGKTCIAISNWWVPVVWIYRMLRHTNTHNWRTNRLAKQTIKIGVSHTIRFIAIFHQRSCSFDVCTQARWSNGIEMQRKRITN